MRKLYWKLPVLQTLPKHTSKNLLWFYLTEKLPSGEKKIRWVLKY